MSTLAELAQIVRSKNSGPFEVTLDVAFSDKEIYEAVKKSNIINQEKICELYHITPERIINFVWFDIANAVKITLLRNVSSGSKGERDTYGAQQSAPLLSIVFPF